MSPHQLVPLIKAIKGPWSGETPRHISRDNYTVLYILHNATVLFPPVAAEPVAASPVAKHTVPFLRTQLCCVQAQLGFT